MNESKYNELIAKIRIKRNRVIVFTIVAVFLVLLLTTPMELYIGDIAIDYKGLPRIRRMIEKKPYTD